MEERYNVYFAGQIMDGFSLPAVRDSLAKVFKADEATLDKLFSGKAQLIKRSCDATTAAKFKQALQRAGAVPVIKKIVAPEAASGPTTSTAPAATMTAAERIAALAAAPDEARYKNDVSDPAATPPAPQHRAADSADDGGIVLAPPGTEVLREQERARPVTRDVDTSRLAVDASAQRLSEVPPPPPPAPGTDHLSMGDVGATIPTLPATAAPLSPNLDGIALAAQGTDFSDCATPKVSATPLDLSHLAALAPGDQPEEERQRTPMPVATPSTDHISLDK